MQIGRHQEKVRYTYSVAQEGWLPGTLTFKNQLRNAHERDGTLLFLYFQIIKAKASGFVVTLGKEARGGRGCQCGPCACESLTRAGAFKMQK